MRAQSTPLLSGHRNPSAYARLLSPQGHRCRVCGPNRPTQKQSRKKTAIAAFWGGGEDRRPSSKNVLDTTMAWGDILTLLATEVVRILVFKSILRGCIDQRAVHCLGCYLEVGGSIQSKFLWAAAKNIKISLTCRRARGYRFQCVGFIARSQSWHGSVLPRRKATTDISLPASCLGSSKEPCC